MYFGNVGWNFLQHNGRDQPKWMEALDACAATGAPGVELIVWHPESLGWWTTATIKDIKRQMEDQGLCISQFCAFATPLASMTSLDAGERRESLDVFRRICEIGAEVGAPLVNFVSPWPQGITAQNDYIPRNYVSDATGGDPKLSLKLPEGFDWPRLWEDHVQVMKECTHLAREHGLRLSL
jgi:sugar phosphate isomerase/epimerase